jgi:AraC family transcriptional regulator
MGEPGIKAVGYVLRRQHFHAAKPSASLHPLPENCIVSAMMEMSLVDVPDMNVLGTKKAGTYTLIPELLMKVFAHIRKNKAAISGPPFFLCHETSPAAVQEANENGTAVAEVAWPVNTAVKGTKDITAYVLPGGRMAHVVHKGPHETCEPTCLALFAWIKEKDLTICGPVREVYLNDPREVSPEEIITDIYVPVR